MSIETCVGLCNVWVRVCSEYRQNSKSSIEDWIFVSQNVWNLRKYFQNAIHTLYTPESRRTTASKSHTKTPKHQNDAVCALVRLRCLGQYLLANISHRFIFANSITHVLHSAVFVRHSYTQTSSSAPSRSIEWILCFVVCCCFSVLLFCECFYSCFAILSLFVAVSQHIATVRCNMMLETKREFMHFSHCVPRAFALRFQLIIIRHVWFSRMRMCVVNVSIAFPLTNASNDRF